MKGSYIFSVVALSAVVAIGIGAISAGASNPPCNNTCIQHGNAWTNLKSFQSQEVDGNNQPVTLGQQTEGKTQVFVGDDAAASSINFGTQTAAGTGDAKQEQGLESGTMINWQANRWPSLTTARTFGGVEQQQAMWSSTPVDLRQENGSSQITELDEVRTIVEGENRQRIDGSVGDVHQKQKISGSSESKAYTNPPFPNTSSFNWGGTLRQHISLSVDNILNW